MGESIMNWKRWKILGKVSPNLLSFWWESVNDLDIGNEGQDGCSMTYDLWEALPWLHLTHLLPPTMDLSKWWCGKWWNWSCFGVALCSHSCILSWHNWLYYNHSSWIVRHGLIQPWNIIIISFKVITNWIYLMSRLINNLQKLHQELRLLQSQLFSEQHMKKELLYELLISLRENISVEHGQRCCQKDEASKSVVWFIHHSKNFWCCE